MTRNIQMETDSVDRISGLPEFVLHDILSILPREDAARTSVLSKRWNRVWESFPILDFEQYTYTKIPVILAELSPQYTEQIDNFLISVKNSLMRSCLYKLRGHKFRLMMTLVDPNLTSKVNECLELALTSGAIEIDIMLFTPYLPRSRVIIFPETMFVSNPFKYYSLQKLCLTGIRMSEKSIQDIVHNCPNIRCLHLVCLMGLQKLDIYKLNKLEEVWIGSTKLLRVDIDAPNLQDFNFSSFGEDFSCAINLTSCQDLRKLELEGFAITDELFHSLISRFPLLEDLTIRSCKMLQRVRISAHHLTSLFFYECNKIVAFEINAPALLSFRYEAELLPHLFLENIPSQLEIVYRLCHIPVNTSRFVNLREFFAISTLGDFLTVTVDTWQVIFDREELRQVVIPPAFQLENLKLEFPSHERSFDKPTLIDGLLWSCHPKTISVSSGTIPQNGCIKVLCESLLDMEKYPTCCESFHIKCWRHDLKSVRIESFGGGLDGQQLVHWTHLLDKLPSDGIGSVICFKLEWDDSIW